MCYNKIGVARYIHVHAGELLCCEAGLDEEVAAVLGLMHDDSNVTEVTSPSEDVLGVLPVGRRKGFLPDPRRHELAQGGAHVAQKVVAAQIRPLGVNVP